MASVSAMTSLGSAMTMTALGSAAGSASLGSGGATPSDTRDSTPLSHFPLTISTGSPFKDKLITALSIPVELTDHKDLNLGYAWQKYKACLAATKTCSLLWETGNLKKIFDRKPTQADIVSIFKGKSQWHLTYSKAFPKVSNYPTMVAWLENNDDKLSDVELWGVMKPAYTFSDLLEWLANDGEGLTKPETETGFDMEDKGKGKDKDKDKEREKEKGKGKGKEKEKVKEKVKDKGKSKKKAKEHL